MGYCTDLLQKFEPKFHQATRHNLTNELCTGILPNHKLFTYLVQDLKFFQLGLNLFGNALRLCDDTKSVIILGKQIGFLCADENLYFHEILKQLKSQNADELQAKLPKMLQLETILGDVQEYLNALHYLAFETMHYGEVITFTYVMEKVYLEWAQYNIKKGIPDDLPFKHLQWLKLHSGAEFESWVAFLEDEVDRTAKDSTCRASMEKWFERTLDLEIAFFDACYDYHE